MDKSKDKLGLIINVAGVVAFIAAMIFATVWFWPQLSTMVEDREKFRVFLASRGYTGVIIFILLQAAQIIIAMIPGEAVQIAGGYVFGTVWGSIYALIGTLLGAVIAFFIARVLGASLVKRLVPEKSMQKFEFLIQSPKYEITMFLLFLIPGIPKDVLVYVAGMTPVRPLRFFSLYMVARLPALIGSAFIGASLSEGDYTTAVVVTAIASLLFVAGIVYKDKIIARLHSVNSGKKDN